MFYLHTTWDEQKVVSLYSPTACWDYPLLHINLVYPDDTRYSIYDPLNCWRGKKLVPYTQIRHLILLNKNILFTHLAETLRKSVGSFSLTTYKEHELLPEGAHTCLLCSFIRLWFILLAEFIWRAETPSQMTFKVRLVQVLRRRETQ